MALRLRNLIVLFCLCVQIHSAQHRDSILFVSTHWDMRDGLPQSSVNSILQSQDGYLWLATFGGLVRFDGVAFTVFDRSTSTGLRSDRILGLYEASNGDLWCMTEDGFVRRHDDTFTTFTVTDGRANYSPSMVGEDSRGTIWITAGAIPYRFENERFVRVPVLRDSQLVRRALLDDGGTWLAHRREILRTLGDSVVRIADLSGLLKFDIIDFVEYPNGSGRYWLATTGEGLVLYTGGKATRFTERDGLPSRFVHRVYVDAHNTLWVSSYNGICRFTGSSFQRVRTIDRTYDNEFNRMFVDREDNLWVGTPANGLHRLRPPVLTPIGTNQGLREEKMLSLTRRQDGSMLFGTNCGGVYEWNNGVATFSAMNRHLPNLCIWSLFEDTRRRVWVGSRTLYRFDDITRKGILFDSTKGFPGLDVFALFEDSRGVVWIGCLNGLFSYDGKTFARHATANGESINDVRTLYEDRSGVLWIGTTHGLYRRTRGAITHVALTVDDGNATPISSSYVRAIHQDREGILWFGTYGGGLLRLKSKHAGQGQERWSVITTRQGLFDNIVSHLVEDENGYFWMGSNRGIARLRRDDAMNVADGTKSVLYSNVFNNGDGMPSAETNGGFQPSTVQDTSGNIYFPTVQGVVKVSTRSIARNDLVPPVYIESVLWFGQQLQFSDEVVLPYDSARIEIGFAALSYVDPLKMQFQTMLEGVEERWSNIGNRRSIVFTGMPPGEHRFRVIASNNDGVWNTQGATMLITVPPPFWKTTWFLMLVGFVLLTFGPSMYYLRVTQLKREKAKQDHFAEQLINSQELERRRIAAELHDGLGQQILVIKNRAELALRQVSDSAKTAQQLHEIVQSAVSSIADVRAISHGLRPPLLEQFGLTDTISALGEQLRRSSTIDWNIHTDDIDGTIPPEKEINLYRILQEGTNNVLKHSSSTQASLMVRRTADGISVSLWDNGKGFNVEERSASGGLGLSGMRERVRTLGGTIELQSSAPKGTVIWIAIPLQHRG